MRSGPCFRVASVSAASLSVVLLLACSTAKTVGETFADDWGRVKTVTGIALPPSPQVRRNDTAHASGVGPLSVTMGDMDVMYRCTECVILSPGGQGRVLHLRAWSGGIEIVCARNYCNSITLSGGSLFAASGWTGATDKGVRIGSTLEQFHAAYPAATFSVGRFGWLADNMLFRFSATGRLSSIKIGSG